MASTERGDDRATIARAQKRFRSWREGRSRGQRIPADLWRVAVKLVDSYPIEQVASELGLNEQRLAKRVGATPGRSGKESEKALIRQNGFVEIGIPGDAAAEFTIEAQSADGGSLVVRVPVTAPDVVTQIVQVLWDRGA